MRYPLRLYGPKGWGDLDDYVRVMDAVEEAAARARGYACLGETKPEPAVEPKVAKSEYIASKDWNPFGTVAAVPSRPAAFDWSRPWLTVRSDLAAMGFGGKTKAEALAWAEANSVEMPD